MIYEIRYSLKKKLSTSAIFTVNIHLHTLVFDILQIVETDYYTYQTFSVKNIQRLFLMLYTDVFYRPVALVQFNKVVECIVLFIETNYCR